jgi:hypothetical protein
VCGTSVGERTTASAASKGRASKSSSSVTAVVCTKGPCADGGESLIAFAGNRWRPCAPCPSLVPPLLVMEPPTVEPLLMELLAAATFGVCAAEPHRASSSASAVASSAALRPLRSLTATQSTRATADISSRSPSLTASAVPGAVRPESEGSRSTLCRLCRTPCTRVTADMSSLRRRTAATCWATVLAAACSIFAKRRPSRSLSRSSRSRHSGSGRVFMKNTAASSRRVVFVGSESQPRAKRTLGGGGGPTHRPTMSVGEMQTGVLRVCWWVMEVWCGAAIVARSACFLPKHMCD